MCLVRCAAAALASSDPAELVWLLAERPKLATFTKKACIILARLLENQLDNKLRATAVGASVVLTQVLAEALGQPDVFVRYAASQALVALTLTTDQGTRVWMQKPPSVCVCVCMCVCVLSSLSREKDALNGHHW